MLILVIVPCSFLTDAIPVNFDLMENWFVRIRGFVFYLFYGVTHEGMKLVGNVTFINQEQFSDRLLSESIRETASKSVQEMCYLLALLNEVV